MLINFVKNQKKKENLKNSKNRKYRQMNIFDPRLLICTPLLMIEFISSIFELSSPFCDFLYFSQKYFSAGSHVFAFPPLSSTRLVPPLLFIFHRSHEHMPSFYLASIKFPAVCLSSTLQPLDRTIAFTPATAQTASTYTIIEQTSRSRSANEEQR